MLNTPTRYGPVTKTLHWLIFVLLITQFVLALAMLDTADEDTFAGLTPGSLFEWHKSIGLIALAVAIARYLWRRLTPLPDWAQHLSEGERRAIHYIERVLYVCIFLMPVSGYLFVTAGGFGVVLFDRWKLPDLIGKHHVLASIAEPTHEVSAALLVLALLAHWLLIFRHQRLHGDRYVQRMLPFTHQR
jgi:cytochrome b561